MRSSPKKKPKTKRKLDEQAPKECKKMKNVTEDIVVKSEIAENCEELNHIATDYEFISVGNMKTELPDYEEFPWEGEQDLENTENSHSVTSMLGSIKTEIVEQNYDTYTNSTKEIEVYNDCVKEENLTESDTGEASESNIETNLLKTSGYPCCYCFISETSLENLSLHISREHYRKQIFVCRICSKEVHSAQYHSVHISKHRLIKCSQCSYEGSSINLNRHRRTQHSSQSKAETSLKFKCADCDMYFFKYSEQLRHEKLVHKKVQPYLRNHIRFYMNRMKFSR